MKTVRILEMDGGGMRGLCSAYFLQRFMGQWGGSDDLSRRFDLITGTSIGGIQSMAATVGQTPSQLIDFFMNDGPQIFQTTEPGQTGRASESWKGRVVFLGGWDRDILIKLGGTIYVYGIGEQTFEKELTVAQLQTPFSFYNNTVLITQLKRILGEDRRLGNITTPMLVTSYEQALTRQPQLFSNAVIKSFCGRNFKAWQCAAATGAAPYYFPYITIDGTPPGSQYIDGGVYLNNTSMMALSMASVLYPEADRVCLLSVGTGLKGDGFGDAIRYTPPDPYVLLDIEGHAQRACEAKIKEFLAQKGMIYNEEQPLRLDSFACTIPDKEGIFPPDISCTFSFVYGDPKDPWIKLSGGITAVNGGTLINYLKSRIQYLLGILEFSTLGSQEAVAKEAELMSYYGQLPARNRFFYYRFQPKFPPGLDVELDNTSPEFMLNMKLYADKTYDEDQFRIGAFIQNLSFGM